MTNQQINLQYTTIKKPLPDFIYDGLKTYSSDANTYKPQPLELTEKLAKKHNLPIDMLYLTAGCDEAIQMFIHAYGEETYAFTPTYVVYKDALEFGKNFTEINSIRENVFSVVPEKFPKATLIFLANPNNPSGFTDKQTVLELVINNPQAVVVIDEVYREFADISVLDEVKNYKNLAVITSFSKNYGMAGNRIGYIVANPEIISVVKNKAQWSNVSYLSVGAAITALDNEEYFKKMRDEVRENREDLVEFLKDNKFVVFDSQINAVLIKFKSEDEGQKFADYLKLNNIIISHGNGNSNIGLDKSYVRISVGTKEQLAELKIVINSYN